MVIHHLHDDSHTLKSCSLVSKACLNTSRRHLFNRIRFSTQLDVGQIGRWAKAPHLTKFVKRIDIGCGWLQSTRFSYPNLFSLVVGLHEEALPAKFLDKVPASFPAVTSLTLDFVKFQMPADAFKLIASFPLLRELQWKNVRYVCMTPTVSRQTCPPHIRHLSLICHDAQENAEPLTRWFTSHRSRIPLRSLSVGWCSEAKHLTSFLDIWSPGLKVLDMSWVLRKSSAHQFISWS